MASFHFLRAARRWPILVILSGLALGPAPAGAQPAATDPELAAIRQILQRPEAELDFAEIKVTVDRIVDPGIAAQPLLNRLNEMAADVQDMLPSTARPDERFEALRAYLYQPGRWNRHRPFSAVAGDPQCRSLADKLLSGTLATRRGNCVSLSLLFLILAQKLGLDATASTAPQQVFVKVRDEAGQVKNLDATTGTLKSDESLLRAHPASPQAIAKGAYLRWLSRHETAALIAELLLDDYAGRSGFEQRRIALSALLLQHNPRQVDAMVHHAAACRQLGVRLQASERARAADATADLAARLKQLEAQARQSLRQAEALGWKPPEPDAAGLLKQAAQRSRKP